MTIDHIYGQGERGRWPGRGYPIGPAPLGWRPDDRIWCSLVIPHTEGDVCQNAEMNADHYAVDLTKPETIVPDMVLMFQNRYAHDVASLFYPDGLVVVERHHADCPPWSGRSVWVTRLGGHRTDPENRWADGFFASLDELSPVTAHVLEAIGGRI